LQAASTTPENSNYNIAYTYFKLKEYEQAGNYFQNQIEKAPSDKVRLNLLLTVSRLPFVTTKYAAAMDAYTKVIESKV
jgi:tetratricopeptide (TPR) repeat protein